MVRPGTVLGKTVYNQNGAVLLAEGTRLSTQYVDALRRRGFSTVYVEDGLSDDVRPLDVVSDQVRANTAAHVAKMFDVVAETAGLKPGQQARRVQYREGTLPDLGDRELSLPAEGMSLLEALYRDVERIMSEILEMGTVASLETLKSHSDYTFQHSVEVAIVSILLGRSLGLPLPQIRELALGALLHDIGKVAIDQGILNKPGRLTRDEHKEIQTHPDLGFELVRRLPLSSILPAHVAYQHHERQDGSGYPRGLVGNNRILRLEAARLRPSRILLIAEIAAVADVFCALASERPYKPAYPLDRVGRTLEELAGHHLNRDVVTALLRTIPMYAVGHWIEVTSGAYRGWRGVVTGVEIAALHAPSIRLHLGPDRESVNAPVELDLRQEPDVKIACIPPGANPFDPPALVVAGAGGTL
jgi:putative nucleotidyltransferase with HDIG domain